MAKARRYQRYKYLYTTDTFQVVIRQQRYFLDENGVSILPITATFLSAVFTGEEKVILFHKQERNLLISLEAGKFKQFLPYPPSSKLLIQHVLEIQTELNNKYQLFCLDYYGESNNNG